MNDNNTQFGMPMVDPAAPSQSQQGLSGSVPLYTSTPMSAEDVDLIEKEWVQKAKEIVRSTQGDPYAQSQRLSEMKADYIKKRYNRQLKADTQS